jgi:hypothetical protein
MEAGALAKRGLLEPLLADPDGAARLAAAGAASAVERADFAFDADESVARHAALAFSTAGTASDPRRPAERARERVLAKLERSPHASVRRIAAQDRLRLDAMVPDSAASRVAARRWLAADPRGLLDAIDARLASVEAEERLTGVELVRVLRLEARFVVRLAELARRSGDAAEVMAAASAVRSLGRLREPAAARAVEAALASPDARVCSNAIEAIAAQVRGAGGLGAAAGRLVEFKEDAQHRVRATALRVLLDELGAEAASGEGLLAMLGDERATHRLAGLWAADRVLMPPAGPERLGRRWSAVAHRVAAIAEQDADEAVRGRAERTARRLLALIGGEAVA